MKPPKVDFLSENDTPQIMTSEGKKNRTRFFLTSIAVISLFFASFGYGRMTYSGTQPVGLSRLNELPIISQVSHLISSPDRQIQGETEDRINILLIGMGGEGHDGPYLTDTIIVASIQPSTKKVSMLSIPRDLLVPMPGDAGWRKLNYANAYGEMREPGRGGETSRAVIEGLLGIEIPYYVRIDFNGFREIIDSVGGVDVYVETAFKDYTYPTEDHLVQTISFDAGWQHMDGDTALKFARSRHGTAGEGSDFARSARQQKVISALRDKVLSGKLLRNPVTITNMLAALRANIATNLQIGEILRLAKIGQDIDRADIGHLVLNEAPGAPLVSGNYGGAYVLLPRNNDWGVIRDIAANLFTLAAVDKTTEPPKPAAMEAETTEQTDITVQENTSVTTPTTVAVSKPKVEILNGNGVSGEARIVAAAATNAGFTISKIGNADNFNYSQTTVYDLTGGDRKEDLTRLTESVGADRTVRGAPKFETGEGIDFIVVLGKK